MCGGAGEEEATGSGWITTHSQKRLEEDALRRVHKSERVCTDLSVSCSLSERAGLSVSANSYFMEYFMLHYVNITEMERSSYICDGKWTSDLNLQRNTEATDETQKN